jgi:hypothetical protein
MEGGAVGHNFERAHPGIIPGFREEDLNVKSSGVSLYF